MPRYSLCVALVTMVAALPACRDETTAPAGTPSTVTITAYVDVDGSGSLSTGDDVIASALIRLRAADGSDSLEAMTAASGVATFSDVPPGSYLAVFAGTPPANAVLASAQLPNVTAPFAGGAVSAEFRFVYEPGAIAGQIYRDDNGNGSYDPGIDTPGSGMTVYRFEGTGPAGTGPSRSISSARAPPRSRSARRHRSSRSSATRSARSPYRRPARTPSRSSSPAR